MDATTRASIHNIVSSFRPYKRQVCPWQGIICTGPLPTKIFSTKHAPFGCVGTVKCVGRVMTKIALDLTALLKTQQQEGFWNDCYATGTLVDRFIKYLVINPDKLKRICEARFLLAPIGKPCKCGEFCRQEPICTKIQLPDLTFLIGYLKNLLGNIDFYWANPIQVLFEQEENVECVSNSRVYELTEILTSVIKIDETATEPLIMNFGRGRVDSDPKTLESLKKAGYPRTSFCDVLLDSLSSIFLGKELDPWIGLFAQNVDAEIKYMDKDAFPKIALILDTHSSTSLFFPAVCHAFNALEHLQLICYFQGSHTTTQKLLELFVPLRQFVK